MPFIISLANIRGFLCFTIMKCNMIISGKHFYDSKQVKTGFIIGQSFVREDILARKPKI